MPWTSQGMGKSVAQTKQKVENKKEDGSAKLGIARPNLCAARPVLVRAEQNSASRRSLEGVLVRALSIGFLLGRFGLRLHWCGALHLLIL